MNNTNLGLEPANTCITEQDAFNLTQKKGTSAMNMMCAPPETASTLLLVIELFEMF